MIQSYIRRKLRPSLSFMGLMTFLIQRLGSIRRDQRGVSAVEFALLSPILVLGGFATVDAGMAVYEEMMISNALRSGADVAISAGSTAQIQTIVDTVAAENFTVASATPALGELTTSVTNYCICPQEPGVLISCVAVCTDTTTPLEFYSISATKQFIGVFLPSFTLSSNVDILVP